MLAGFSIQHSALLPFSPHPAVSSAARLSWLASDGVERHGQFLAAVPDPHLPPVGLHDMRHPLAVAGGTPVDPYARRFDNVVIDTEQVEHRYLRMPCRSLSNYLPF